MGAFDQFKDQATQYEEKARSAAGNKRDKSANPQQEQMERGAQRDAQQRGSEFEDRARDRMDRDAEEEQDWA
jgi:hypothetical protein